MDSLGPEDILALARGLVSQAAQNFNPDLVVQKAEKIIDLLNLELLESTTNDKMAQKWINALQFAIGLVKANRPDSRIILMILVQGILVHLSKKATFDLETMETASKRRGEFFAHWRDHSDFAKVCQMLERS